ncbi:M23 family metallopeptidase [Actinoplanes sp. NPDC049265]|uniref:M23 family metallopeptidase n=1 Tax=Actinoplanes sp. NPDC049265 TaxID=3363902 RepID=UPI00370FF62E
MRNTARGYDLLSGIRVGGRPRPGRNWLVAVLCLAVVIAPAGPAVADPHDDAKRAGRAVDRAEAVLEDATVQARAAAQRLEAATAALPAAQQKVASARGVVAAARAQANTARRKADAARTAYQKIRGRFAQAQGQVEAARDRVDEIASASYKGGDIAAINVLVGATGPQDAMDRLGLVDQVMRKQQKTVAQVVVARREVRTEQDRAGLAQRTAEAAEADAADKLKIAARAEDAAEDAQAAVVELADTRRAAFVVANSQRAVVLAKYREAEAEEQRVVAALQTWENKNGGSSGGGTYSGGILLMPVHGYKSSDFGTRYDPYYRVWQLHAGVDLAAGGGSPIHAAADGRVIRAGWAGGYGQYTCISHGNRFSTCYGHQSEIDVYVGQRIRRGQVIGKVGTTGASTGNHLHFETRVNGVPKNPLKYLPSCLC